MHEWPRGTEIERGDCGSLRKLQQRLGNPRAKVDQERNWVSGDQFCPSVPSYVHGHWWGAGHGGMGWMSKPGLL